MLIRSIARARTNASDEMAESDGGFPEPGSNARSEELLLLKEQRISQSVRSKADL